jgi:hypothetical protein
MRMTGIFILLNVRVSLPMKAGRRVTPLSPSWPVARSLRRAAR